MSAIIRLRDGECGICHDEELDLWSHVGGEAHGYCKPCLEEWLYLNPTCPHCRLDVDPSGLQSRTERVMARLRPVLENDYFIIPMIALEYSIMNAAGAVWGLRVLSGRELVLGNVAREVLAGTAAGAVIGGAVFAISGELEELTRVETLTGMGAAAMVGAGVVGGEAIKVVVALAVGTLLIARALNAAYRELREAGGAAVVARRIVAGGIDICSRRPEIVVATVAAGTLLFPLVRGIVAGGGEGAILKRLIEEGKALIEEKKGLDRIEAILRTIIETLRLKNVAVVVWPLSKGMELLARATAVRTNEMGKMLFIAAAATLLTEDSLTFKMWPLALCSSVLVMLKVQEGAINQRALIAGLSVGCLTLRAISSTDLTFAALIVGLYLGFFKP